MGDPVPVIFLALAFSRTWAIGSGSLGPQESPVRRLFTILPAALLTIVIMSPLQASHADTAAPPQWTITPSPSRGTGGSTLLDVAALSPTDAWAVGSWTDRIDSEHLTPSPPLIEHWDGTAWTEVPSPDLGEGEGGALNTVVAISPSDVWAAGDQDHAAGETTSLIEHWDGSAWNVVPGPAQPEHTSMSIGDLARVPGTSTLWGVGSIVSTEQPPAFIRQPIAARWDGGAWHMVPVRIPPIWGAFNAVAAAGPNDVMAVGDRSRPNGPGKTLSEHWDGSSWKIIPTPNPWPGDNDLLGISKIPGASTMRAVGSGKNSGTRTIAELWAGARWTVELTPNPDIGTTPSYAYLNGVVALRGDRAWAVGFTLDGRSLIELWNGAWQIVPSPNQGGDGYYRSVLISVAHVPGTGQSWAVGVSNARDPHDVDSTYHTLVEHYG